jgi:nucleoid-associated protein YgaU
MARETKIGLLVGMGFIVCFAIILSKRGADHPASPRRGYPTLTTASQSPITPRIAEQRAQQFGRRLPLDRKRATVANPLERPAAPEPPDRSEPVIADAETPPPPDPAGRTLSDVIPELEAEPEKLVDVRPAAEPPVQAEPLPETNHRLAARPPVTPAPEPPPVVERPLPPPAPTRPYVVEKGDTLTRIARRCYGKSSPDIVNAIYEANREILSAPDRLLVGQTIQLPERIGALAIRDASRSSPSARAPGGGTAPVKKLDPPSKSKTYRWYTIRKGDRYETIAKRELGDARRWKEVYELNKKKFPKPSDIKWGIKIKLPVK